MFFSNFVKSLAISYDIENNESTSHLSTLCLFETKLAIFSYGNLPIEVGSDDKLPKIDPKKSSKSTL